jgi:predicted homoserine dehydrogenase-like protein
VILVDSGLAERHRQGRPVRVGMVGAGFMGRGVARQIVRSTPGMQLVAVANRHLAGAERAYREAGVDDVAVVEDDAGLSRAAAAGRPAVTEDASLLCRSEAVDVVCDVTGAVGFGAAVTVEAIEHGRHVVTMNAELDGTVGPYLKVLADRAGVVFSGVDGDQPGVQRNLHRFVLGIGAEPLVCGNIEGLQDPYRTPTTQEGFARRWGQDPHMVTSFADGTKISFEQAVVANATGMTVGRRGMGGAEHHGHVDELVDHYDVEQLRSLGGVVDYVVGARPGPGVYVLAAVDDPSSRHYLELYKLGTGPLYSFYTPYHLCHFEVPASLARAVLFGDAVIASAGAPRVDVVATAKRELPAGTVLDGLGGYDTYGQAETAEAAAAEGLLAMGLAEGCRLRRALARDEVLRVCDVEVPVDRLVDRLRGEQGAHFGVGSLQEVSRS